MRTIYDLNTLVGADAGLRALIAKVQKRLSKDPGHDLSHAMRVAFWAIRLGGSRVDRREAIAAALCHDLVNLPKDSPRRAEASSRSAALARRLLPEFGFNEEAILTIGNAIRDHSYSRGAVPATPLGKALQDADRLDALGAIGIMRTVSTGNRMGTRYFHPTDPWAIHRPLDDQAFSVDHFFTKLLRLAETMCTRAGRTEALRRASLLEGFLNELATEIGMPRPKSDIRKGGLK